MTGIRDFTAQFDAKVALFEAAQLALAAEEVDVTFGFRWPFIFPDWFSVTETEGDVDPRTVGPRQSLDEVVTLTVSVGSWRSGDDSATEIAAAQRAFQILRIVQQHIRNTDRTLNDTLLWCLPGRASSAGATTTDDSNFGRLTEIAAEFVGRARIRNT